MASWDEVADGCGYDDAESEERGTVLVEDVVGVFPWPGGVERITLTAEGGSDRVHVCVWDVGTVAETTQHD